MTLNEIQAIAEIAGTYDLDFSDQSYEFNKKIYRPVREAVAEGNTVVISFIENCDKGVQGHLYTALESGAIRGQNAEAVRVYKKKCNEDGLHIDSRVMFDKDLEKALNGR